MKYLCFTVLTAYYYKKNFFDMTSKMTVLNGITLPQDLDEEISKGKEIEIIIKTNSIVGDGPSHQNTQKMNILRGILNQNTKIIFICSSCSK